jgi:cell division septal protein FtsQ
VRPGWASGGGTWISTIEATLRCRGSAQAAWSLLARLEREQSLLARDISVIDMRLPDRLVVRLGPAAELRRQPGNDT